MKAMEEDYFCWVDNEESYMNMVLIPDRLVLLNSPLYVLRILLTSQL